MNAKMLKRLCADVAYMTLLMFAIAIAPHRALAQDLADYDYTNLSFRGVGFAYGKIWPTKVVPTSSYTLRVDLGYLGPAVRITPNISYWNSTMRTRELDRLADRLELLPALQANNVQLSAADLGPVQWSDLSVGVDGEFVWTAPMNTLTYVGGGVSLHALNGRGDLIQNTFVEDLLDSTSPGFTLLFGVENQLIPRFRVFGEARYTMMSDVHYPELKIGGSLMWPTHAATAATQGGR